jgi:hypothetical protein
MKLFIISGLLFVFNPGNRFNAHPPAYSPIVFQKAPKRVFQFLDSWAYAWDVIKHDNGKFEKIDADSVTSADTVHLHYTANCKTNVQGGYNIHYCYALKGKKEISLVFADGMPAYASEFDVSIVGNTYSVKPKIIYPGPEPADKLVYSVTYSKLILFQKVPAASKSISGYIDMRFTEGNPTARSSKQHQYYLRGYFKTTLKAG